jgi:hypothetical protein
MVLTRLRSSFGGVAAVCVFAVFLIFSPDTGEDYSFYKEGYEGITFSDTFPFVFGVDSVTVDQGFLWYMGIFKLFFDSYSVFLSINFILFMYMMNYVLDRHYAFNKTDVRNLLYLAFPVIIPVVFYWSPRSGPSLLAMILLASTLLSRHFLYSMALAFFAIIVHSQYVPNVFGLFTFYIFIGKNMRKTFLLAFGSSLVVMFPLIYSDFAFALASLADGSLKLIFMVAMDKLHYFVDGSVDGHFRYSFLLLLILEFFIMYFLLQDVNRLVQDKLIYLLTFSVAFSLVVNLLFWDSAHLAGRIARFSDWILATVGVGYWAKKVHSQFMGAILVNFVGVLSIIVYFPSVYYIKY